MLDAEINDRLVYELKLLNSDREECLARLDELDAHRRFKLKRNKKRNGKSYYSVKAEGSVKYQYIGKESDNKIIRRIKDAAHLEKSIDIIDQNIELIENFRSNYQSYDFMSADSLLPYAYKSETRLCTSVYHDIACKWKAEMIRHQARFPENHPERKTEKTADGTLVKSKNEVIIYNRLIDAGLICVYELPLAVNDYGPPMYPDFTVLSPIDFKTEIIIEHIGMLDSYSYREDFVKRIDRYIRMGYEPGVNLLFTFSDRDGHIDSLQINKVVADIKGLR